MIVHLVLEGMLEEPVAAKLVQHCGHTVGVVRGRQGAGYIRKRVRELTSLATSGAAVFVLTDFMDTGCPCVPAAINLYLGRPSGANAFFLLRFAVQELESWLLADQRGIADFLGIPLRRVPSNPETLTDPKRELVNLARRSPRRSLREGIVPDQSHGGAVAPGYLFTMSQFIHSHWNPSTAQTNAPSLQRCLNALARLA